MSVINPTVKVFEKFNSAMHHLVLCSFTQSHILAFLQPKPSLSPSLKHFWPLPISCATIFIATDSYNLMIFHFLSNHTSKLCYSSAISVSKSFLKCLSFWPNLTSKTLRHRLLYHYSSLLLFGLPNIHITASISRKTIFTHQIFLVA